MEEEKMLTSASLVARDEDRGSPQGGASGAAPPETTLKWRYREHWSGESAEFTIGGIKVYVKDMDGDFSYWVIRRGRRGPILAEGEDWTACHWAICLWEAEVAIRKIVADRIAELRSVSDGSPQGSRPKGLIEDDSAAPERGDAITPLS